MIKFGDLHILLL